MEMVGCRPLLRYVLEVELSGFINRLDGVCDGKRWNRSNSCIWIFDLGNWRVPLVVMRWVSGGEIWGGTGLGAEIVWL